MLTPRFCLQLAPICGMMYKQYVIASQCAHWRGNPLRSGTMHYYVYILTNENDNVMYVGITNDLIRRVYEHKNHLDRGSFTARYNVVKLVYIEETSDVQAAIEREKQIKGWNRKHKNKLVESKNPNWNDLYERLL